MMTLMRTTLTLEDRLAAELKKRAYEQGKSFKQVVNETVQAGLEVTPGTKRATRYRIKPSRMGTPRAGVDLDRALRLADALEDAAIVAELEARK